MREYKRSSDYIFEDLNEFELESQFDELFLQGVDEDWCVAFLQFGHPIEVEREFLCACADYDVVFELESTWELVASYLHHPDSLAYISACTVLLNSAPEYAISKIQKAIAQDVIAKGYLRQILKRVSRES